MKKETSQVANELIKRLDTHLNDESVGDPFFPERGVRPFPLTTEGFKVIQRIDSDRKTAFVDGGNQEVFGAPNFSVQLNRVYFGMWNGNRRIPERVTPKRIEFFAATLSDFEGGRFSTAPRFSRYLATRPSYRANVTSLLARWIARSPSEANALIFTGSAPSLDDSQSSY